MDLGKVSSFTDDTVYDKRQIRYFYFKSGELRCLGEAAGASLPHWILF